MGWETESCPLVQLLGAALGQLAPWHSSQAMGVGGGGWVEMPFWV